MRTARISRALEAATGMLRRSHVRRRTKQCLPPYMFRYDPSRFAGLPRAAFLKALGAEGVSALSGYSPLTKSRFSRMRYRHRIPDDLPQSATGTRGARRTVPPDDRPCTEAIWLVQTMRLGPKRIWMTSPTLSERCRRPRPAGEVDRKPRLRSAGRPRRWRAHTFFRVTETSRGATSYKVEPPIAHGAHRRFPCFHPHALGLELVDNGEPIGARNVCLSQPTRNAQRRVYFWHLRASVL